MTQSSRSRPLNSGTIINIGLIVVGLVAIAAIVAVQLLSSGQPPPAVPLDIAVRFEPVADGFESLVFLAGAGDGSGDRYVVEQNGRILRLGPDGTDDPEPFLDIRDRVLHHHERGLLGLAFHPAFAENRRFLVVYSRSADGATQVSEFTVPEAGEAVPIASTERPIMVIPQRSTMHKGGMIAFDHEGMLLVGIGDGSTGNDPERHGQDRASLLAKLLRLDVDRGWPYGIPADNGFVADPAAHGEIHAIGLRNPWRFSVDRASGDVYIGDVGQADWEEIDVLRRGRRTVSFGWSEMEGAECFYGRECDPADHEPPAIVYPHVDGEIGHCGVIGGYAYRGDAGSLPDGAYLYADYCSGTTWAVPVEQLLAGRATPVVAGVVDPAYGQVQSFGEDDAGELYLVTSGGHVLHIRAEAGEPADAAA